VVSVVNCAVIRFRVLPIAVLKHLGAQLRLAPPRLASIRALYRRQRTLFDHQRVAMEVLGFRHLTDHAERGLTAHLRRSAEATFSGEALTAVARVWLYEHGYVLPGDRRVADVVRAALRHAEQTPSSACVRPSAESRSAARRSVG
jgi:hypothetical protein